MNTPLLPSPEPLSQSLEQIGSAGTPGILLIARPFPLGNGYCLVNEVLYSCPINQDGSFERSPAADGPGFDWGQVYEMSEAENRALEPVIRALGGEYDRVAANFCR